MPVSPTLPRTLPETILSIRDNLKGRFNSDDWAGEAWGQVQASRLRPLIHRVSYVQALVSGAWRLYLEYRDCDKLPHYRLTWHGLFFGRVDVDLDTNTYSSQIHASRSLPLVQAKLAVYLAHAGYTANTARLRPQRVIDTSSTDTEENTATREYRLFRINVERESRYMTPQKESI